MKYLPFILLILCGCSSLPEKVFKEVKKGDSASKVASSLGTPASFKANRYDASFDEWLYLEKDQKCVILLKDSVVRRTKCGSAN